MQKEESLYDIVDNAMDFITKSKKDNLIPKIIVSAIEHYKNNQDATLKDCLYEGIKKWIK